MDQLLPNLKELSTTTQTPFGLEGRRRLLIWAKEDLLNDEESG